jgi:pimeloyl-ACP methyl ester carboxylesterase
MAPDLQELVIPRPGKTSIRPQDPVSGPSEKDFTEAFGTLLPPADFLYTPNGKAAYYELHPSPDSNNTRAEKHTRMLFIHGVQTPALGMLPLARALHSAFPHAHLVLLDLWGHGLSDTPIVPHEANLFHELIDALLDRLNWHAAHLVGFSFGGSLTTGYVATRPERVQSYVLVAPAGLRRSADFDQAHLRGDDEVAARKWVLELLEGGDLVVPEDWKERVQRGEVVAEAVREWQMRHHPGHTASVVAIFRDGGVMDKHSQFEKAANTEIPAQVVLGELDDLCNEQQLRELGFQNVAVVPGVGHGVVRERVPEVADLITGFWQRTGLGL